MDCDPIEPGREGTRRVVPLDGSEKLDKHILGNVLGQVVVARYAVSRSEDCLVMELKENPQALVISSLTLANCLLLLQCPSLCQGRPILTYRTYSIYSFCRGKWFILRNESGRQLVYCFPGYYATTIIGAV